MNSRRTPLRVKLACGILCGVFAASAAAFCIVQKRCGRLYAETEQALGAVTSGAAQAELDAAAETLRAAWQREERWLELLISGEVLADLGEAVSRLPAETAVPDTMRAELLALRSDLSNLMRQERSVF